MQSETPQRILITGGSSGIGLEASKRLIQKGHQLTLLCRTEERCLETMKTLSAERAERASAEGLTINLQDLQSVETGCGTLLQKNEPIDTIILNAGIQNVGLKKPQFTKQAIEETFCVNHLAHQHIVMRLLPLLLKSKKPRLVITSSEVHNPMSGGGRVGKPATLGTLDGLRHHKHVAMINGQIIFDADKAYKDSKLCNILMARYLANKLKQKGQEIPVITWSPGLVIPKGSGGFFRTSRQHNPIGLALFSFVARDLLRLTETVEKAGALLADLADGSNDEQNGFQYISNQLISPGRHIFKKTETSQEGENEKLGEELWTLSKDLIEHKLLECHSIECN
ncbi:SDR family NAD(P)-dependent oxidoreductase [Synechococcus sp. MU1655]|uniref:SDR family NAD(P)-dependent oxidoreductase n=1 Tax=Synechococcus sp. MU1655 TaxID=2508355 RepID=UPI0020261BE9|nr:SDR family NAD(P)-dependent oxidoreductase [Synechococcus sp. MU1655]